MKFLDKSPGGLSEGVPSGIRERISDGTLEEISEVKLLGKLDKIHRKNVLRNCQKKFLLILQGSISR